MITTIYYEYNGRRRGYEPDFEEWVEAICKSFGKAYDIEPRVVEELIYNDWLDFESLKEEFFDDVKKYLEKNAFDCFCSNDEYGL